MGETTDRALNDILEDMLNQVGSGDPESAHNWGDGLLVELVRKLAQTLPDEDRAIVLAIIDAYIDIEKWYA